MLQRSLRLAAVLGGIALGFWLAQPSDARQTTTYQVRPGDSLTALAVRLNVSPEDLVAWNRDRYPRIASGRLQEGWTLVVYTDTSLPRWRVLITPLLNAEPARAALDAVVRWFQEQDSITAWRHYDAEHTFYVCVNDGRAARGASRVEYDPELFELAQARAEIYTGVRTGSLTDYPLCDGCVELRAWGGGVGFCGRPPKEWLNNPLFYGEYRAAGVGFVGASDIPGSFRPLSVAIFRP